MKAILWFVSLVAAGVYICGPIMDPDLWWHITAGRWIIAHLAVPHIDYWNLFGYGQPWRAYSWSNEIVFAFLDRTWPIHGLLSLKLIIAMLYAISLGYCFSKLARDWFIGCLLAIFTVAASYNHFTLRPQSIVWIYFVWAIYLTEKLIGLEDIKRARIALMIVFTLWANTHITTALGIFAVAAWSFDSKTPTRFVWPCFLAFLATCITPYFGGEWLTFFSKTGHPFEMRAISEFQPANIMQYPTVFLILAIAVFFLLLGGRATKVGPVRLMACLVFVVGGLAVVKFLPLAVIFTCSLIATLWRDEAWATEKTPFVEGVQKLRELINWIPREGLSFLLICYTIVLINRVWQAPISNVITPIEAVDFIKQQNLKPPILNDFGRGGYMMYRFSDMNGELPQEYRVPIDGRTNVNPREVWKKAHAALAGQHNWRDYLDLVKPETVLWRNESPLVSLLIATGEWCRVFKSGSENDGYSVLVRRNQSIDSGCL